MSLEPGQILEGKYRIERLLGAGGMGEVFAATHLELGELVAIKLMLDDDVSSNALARFQREARAAARLKSEFVVRVLDVGRREGGLPFMVLEHIDGQDLHQLVTSRGPLPITEAASLLAQVCEGVAEAHALGMVHRDLKLKNLFLTKRPDGTPLVKILDFGVVKVSSSSPQADQPSLTLTAAESIVGSLPYMAPEQISMSSKVDARADVWSLGVCLYELLAGTRPFRGSSAGEIVMGITRRPPPHLRSIRPEIPQDLADTVERALEKSLHRRFQSVAELARALSSHVSDPTLGDRVQAILQGGVQTRAAPVVAAPMLAATSTWVAQPREPEVEVLTAPELDGSMDATTQALPRRAYAVQAPPPAPPAPPVGAFVVTRHGAGPSLFLAVGALVAIAGLAGWIGLRRQAASRAPAIPSATTMASTDLPEARVDAGGDAPAPEPAIASAAPLGSSLVPSSSAHARPTPPSTKPHPRPAQPSAPPPMHSSPYDTY